MEVTSTSELSNTDPVMLPPSALTQTSRKAEIKLAKHLKAQGAKLYGTYWSFHSYQQIELFGIEAFEYVRYREAPSPLPVS
ncbi:MAG: hypothetical protein ACFCU8_13590 [Thermosynechococcaceae cyanobacterium]